MTIGKRLVQTSPLGLAKALAPFGGGGGGASGLTFLPRPYAAAPHSASILDGEPWLRKAAAWMTGKLFSLSGRVMGMCDSKSLFVHGDGRENLHEKPPTSSRNIQTRVPPSRSLMPCNSNPAGLKQAQVFLVNSEEMPFPSPALQVRSTCACSARDVRL